MPIPPRIRGAALLSALAVTAGPFASAHAAPGDSVPATVHAVQSDSCSASPAQITVLNFNDFHGRIAGSSPDTVAFFGQLEQYRAEAGEDNTLLLSAGDNIGGSLFASFAQDDNPTIDILNAAGLDAAAVGNHEFDRGWVDLRDRVEPRAEFTQLGANVYEAGTTTTALPAYATFEKAGATVAVIGAVTSDLPSLVSPSGLSELTIGDPVEAVNRVAAQLSDGDPANGEADVIIAEYHEGARSGGELASEIAASDVFGRIVNETSDDVDAIFNAHTHQEYAYAAPVPGADDRTRPVVQSGSYAELIGKVELGLDAGGEVECFTLSNNPVTLTQADALAYPRAAAIKGLVDTALAEAEVIGTQVIGQAAAPIQRGLAGSGDNRAVESTMSNLVAQMFREQLGNNDAEFIGVQNPGGTRADLDSGDITYQEAASILPFANSLMTTQLTGAQITTMLEQQWQRDETGAVPTRPFLALGLSENVTYTYDESRPEGQRITSITINGQPIDAAKLYTVGSGSFLIAGGDNFRVIAEGQNTRDSGRVDLEAWVDWLRNADAVEPDYSRRGVSMNPMPTELAVGNPVTVAVGVPQGADPKATDTLDINTGTLKNSELTAVLITGGREFAIGSAPVVDGRVEALTLTLPADAPDGPAVLELRAVASGTLVSIHGTIASDSLTPAPGGPAAPGGPEKPRDDNEASGGGSGSGSAGSGSNHTGSLKYPDKDRRGGLAKTGASLN